MSEPVVLWLSRGEPHLPAGDGWLSDGERGYAASKSFTKRRVEFLVARWTLKQAVVRTLSLPDSADVFRRIEARHRPDGAPSLYIDGEPAPYDVSMTDRAGWAVCVLGPPGSGVGVDLELVEPRSDGFVCDYFTEAEQHAVAEAAASVRDGHALAANLIWSAKESALKVLHTGLRSDTRSVEVTVEHVAAAEGTWSPLRVRTASSGENFNGWWRRTGAFVLTTCARSALPAPESLEQPSALDDADPVHSWMRQPVTPA